MLCVVDDDKKNYCDSFAKIEKYLYRKHEGFIAFTTKIKFHPKDE